MSRALAIAFILWAFVESDNVLGQLKSGAGSVPPEAAKFFEGVEKSVQLIAENVLLNYRNRQTLWSNCNKKETCTPFACKPLKLDTGNSMCVAYPGSPVCQAVRATSLGCKNVTQSTNSYIRVPSSADEYHLTCDAQMAICAQKGLDEQAFVKVYEDVKYGGLFNLVAWSMFGAYNGIFRIYPGLELPPQNCTQRTYDPRKRVWYKAVTGISKQVIVMIDTGGPMAGTLSIPLGPKIQVLNAAQRIASEFLDTLNRFDVVSVYTFDSSGAQLIHPKVEIPQTDSEIEALKSLKDAIDSITVTPAAAKANLTTALETAFHGFDTSPSLDENLKIVLVITAGDLLEVSTAGISSIYKSVNTSIRTFIYDLTDSSKRNNSSDVSANLKSVACALEGLYNQIPRENILDDPISALQSFYSYVAYLRFNMDDEKKPLWVPSYSAATSIGDVMAVAYPVFDGEVLIGVANVDLIGSVVEDTWPKALELWSSAADIKHTSGGPLNCTASLRSDALDCPDDGGFKRGLCLDESLTFADTKFSYSQRTCCDGDCVPSPKKRGADGNTVILATVVPVSTALVVLLTCILSYRWRESLSHCCLGAPKPNPNAKKTRAKLTDDSFAVML